MQKCFAAGILEKIVDPIPEEILNRYNLPTLKTALQWIHTPKKADHAASARKRFAFEEVFIFRLPKLVNEPKSVFLRVTKLKRIRHTSNSLLNASLFINGSTKQNYCGNTERLWW